MKRQNLIAATIALIIGLTFLFAGVAQAQSTITLSWDAVTENTDGSLYTDQGGYKVYRHDTGDVYTEVADIPHTQTTTDRTNVGIGTYCYVVTAYNTANRESAYSNEACISVTIPNAVYELRITIN